MKKSIIFSSLLILGLFQPALAKKIRVDEAMTVARNFYFERISQYRSVDYSVLYIRDVIAVHEQEEVVFYAFNIGSKGYVIVSADDAVPPVVAYSFDSDYPQTNPPPQFTAWLEQYKSQITSAKQSGAKATGEVRKEWSRLLCSGQKELQPFRDRNVEPFTTSHWNQGFPYNEQCPASESGVHAVVGCVPVAMGQILYYYRWPLSGKGSYTYTDANYGVQSADFGATEYKWNNMKDVANASNDGIAELLYHLGVSCDLVYGAGGSGMYNHKAAYALRTFFKFSPETQYIFRDSTLLDWDSLIIAHLDRKMPLYYAGWSVPNIEGHAFVCDGYQGSDYFHFNFGWGGSADGYFYIDNLNPSGYNFNLAQELIINCYPDTLNYTYPVHCQSAANILNYKDGSVEDGSGPFADYRKPSFCGWLIHPQNNQDSVTDISVTFNRFDVSPTDTLVLYDGGSSHAPVLAKYTGNTLPEPVKATGNSLYVYFKTSGEEAAPGWLLNYTSTVPLWCTGTQLITTDTAEITDGSLRFNYANNINCKWKLFPANGESLTVYFRYFDTEPGKDILKIVDFGDQVVLAELSGHYDEENPPPPVTAPSGKMYLIFSTNGSVSGNGWAMTYPASPVGISEHNIPDLTIAPNPAADHLSVSFSNRGYRSVSCEIYDQTGKRVIQETRLITNGMIKREFNTRNLPDGLYILKIVTDRDLEYRKLIIAH